MNTWTIKDWSMNAPTPNDRATNTQKTNHRSVNAPTKVTMTGRDAQRRRSVRLKDFDYASVGAYFVTLCTFQRQLFFDHLKVRQLAEACWREIPAHEPSVRLDEWVVMPNHVHGIIGIGERNNDTAGRGVQLNAPTADDKTMNTGDSVERRRDANNRFSVISPQRRTLGVIVRTYKAAVTTACRGAHLDFGWQRGFYEHIIRNAQELSAIRRYVQENPLQWALDRDNPASGRPPAGGADGYWDELPM